MLPSMVWLFCCHHPTDHLRRPCVSCVQTRTHSGYTPAAELLQGRFGVLYTGYAMPKSAHIAKLIRIFTSVLCTGSTQYKLQ